MDFNSRPIWYKLEGKTPVPCSMEEFIEWQAELLRTTGKRVVHVKDIHLVDGTRVSTVFLAFDHGMWSEKPILFETMIFGGDHDGYQERYSTWDEAEIGHAYAVELASREIRFTRVLTKVIPIFQN